MKKFILPAVITALSMTACSNEEEVLPSNVEGIQTISAEIMQPAFANASRIIVDGQPGDATRPLRWRADDPTTKANEADVIYVYDSKGNAARFIYSEKEDGTNGIFNRDPKVGSAISDIKNALCVTSSVGRAKDLPESINAEFNYASTMIYHRGAENAPMYGTMKNGVLRFNIATSLVELDIKNLAEFRNAQDQMLGIKIEAFKKGKKTAEYISSTKAKLINTQDPTNATVELVENEAPYIGLFLQKDTSVDTKVYFPLITGEYSALQVTMYPNTNFGDPKKALSKTVTITLNKGENFPIEKKLYSFAFNMPGLSQETFVPGDLTSGDTSGWKTSLK